MKAMDLYSQGESPQTLAEGVFICPRMYTLDGTLEEAAAFLNGFYSGRANPNGNDETALWIDFSRWACKIVGVNGYTCYQLFSEIRRIVNNDDEGFAKLAELFIQFRKERESA